MRTVTIVEHEGTWEILVDGVTPAGVKRSVNREILKGSAISSNFEQGFTSVEHLVHEAEGIVGFRLSDEKLAPYLVDEGYYLVR